MSVAIRRYLVLDSFTFKVRGLAHKLVLQVQKRGAPDMAAAAARPAA